ncbi:hypothetical protein KP79_PYT19684 [Mizuhopecten yessoensis]|uniref:Uncharacterized protein n=1 Tax=Mizuhopecten yessoensis TaxID=6573 RepID=A0A210PU62_MIZYE|nr:hypothetical protein KP79_PYT19684 [Mizuhopecten yessoensis]
MAKRSRFTRIREQVANLFSNIRTCIRELWTAIQQLCIPEESASGHGDFLLLTDITKVTKEDQCTNCEQILKVSMACQTDAQLFNNALYALGDSSDDCAIDRTERHPNKKRSSKSSHIRSDVDAMQQNRTSVLNFNENYSAERNRSQVTPSSAPVQITRSPRPIVNQNSQTTRSAGLDDRDGKIRGENMVNLQRKLESNFQTHAEVLCGSGISDTIYYSNRRSIATSPAVTYADACCQTFLSIAANAIFLPVTSTPTLDNQKSNTADCHGNEDQNKGDSKKKSEKEKVNNVPTLNMSNQVELPNDSVFYFKGKPSSNPLTSVDIEAKKDTRLALDLHKDSLLTEEKALSRGETSQIKLQDKTKVTHKAERKDRTPTKANEKKSLTRANENEQKLKVNETNRTSKTSGDSNKLPTKSKDEKREVKPVESKVESPHCNSTSRAMVSPVVKCAAGRMEKANVYGRENYIKVMLLKIVEKIPHIKKMKTRQDSLPEGDPERDRLYKAINTEIKKNINEGMEKFYVRYNALHPLQRANTTELEKNFLMDLISEMKKADKEFLAEETKAHEISFKRQGDGNPMNQREINKKNIPQTGEMETKHDQRLKQTQESNRQVQVLGNVSVDVTQVTTTEVVTKPKHRNKSRHRKNVVTESAAPIPYDNKMLLPEVKKVEQDEKKGRMEEVVHTQPEDISTFIAETTASEAGTSEDGDIIDLMNDLEDEAHRDGLFVNWDATPFGDIAEFFDRGHYRIDGQTVVSKGKRAYKVEERQQKVKRRGIPNKHLANTSNYLQESAGDAHTDPLFQEDANEVEEDVVLEENVEDQLDSNVAYETLSCLNSPDEATDISVNVEEEPMMDARHLKDMPCDVILKKKGECDLLEEKYAVEKTQKNKGKPKKKKKAKKTTLYAINFTNNANDEVSDSDDYDDSDSGDESDLDSDDESDTESDDSENEAAHQARIAQYTEILQSIPNHT